MSKKTRSGQVPADGSLGARGGGGHGGSLCRRWLKMQRDEEAIVVTGTRLVRQDFEAISPITTVSAEQLELHGHADHGIAAQRTSADHPGQHAYVEQLGRRRLRHRRPSRPRHDPRPGAPERRTRSDRPRPPVRSTSTPSRPTLISRIEVVTGGPRPFTVRTPSAGVVNFVLKDDYEGAEVTMTYGSGTRNRQRSPNSKSTASSAATSPTAAATSRPTLSYYNRDRCLSKRV